MYPGTKTLAYLAPGDNDKAKKFYNIGLWFDQLNMLTTRVGSADANQIKLFSLSIKLHQNKLDCLSTSTFLGSSNTRE
jgi:hypothetical protein